MFSKLHLMFVAVCVTWLVIWPCLLLSNPCSRRSSTTLVIIIVFFALSCAISDYTTQSHDYGYDHTSYAEAIGPTQQPAFCVGHGATTSAHWKQPQASDTAAYVQYTACMHIKHTNWLKSDRSMALHSGGQPSSTYARISRFHSTHE